jgi:tryptophan synthase beta chain
MSQLLTDPDVRGHFGPYGGMYVPETLMYPLEELTRAYFAARSDPAFQDELAGYLRDYVGRPTPLYFAERMSREQGAGKIYFKREDLCHTGAHKINNSLGQVLLARRMGKPRVIAETGAGQHGVATATAAAMFGMECVIYMGAVDMARQELNVFRMQSLGAEVVSVTAGQQTLKEAISEAMRDWVSSVRHTHYVLGSALGSHPYPLMVREFQSVIGREARLQIQEREGRLPTQLVACVGGGSNSIGLFHPFLNDIDTAMIGVEAGGLGIASGRHAARFSGGRLGILQGTKTFVLQDEDGQIQLTHSVSAGLDYAAIGPEHSLLRDVGRATYVSVTDEEAVRGFDRCCRWEGIVPALETAHAIAYLTERAKPLAENDLVVVNLSGRGDKDVAQLAAWKQEHGAP